jgi:hypothetical protein
LSRHRYEIDELGMSTPRSFGFPQPVSVLTDESPVKSVRNTLQFGPL